MIPQLRHKAFVQRDSCFRPCCRNERGALALAAVAVQRELRYHQHLPRHILKREVHLIIFIGENPQAGAFFGKIGA